MGNLRHNQVEAITRLRDCNRNISIALSFLRTTIDPQLISNLEETKEQFEYDLDAITKEVDKGID